MARSIPVEKLSGVWSAAPTPFDNRMELDKASVKRMVEHHVKLGVNGLFLAGTNGEGPWMPDRQRRALVQEVVKHAKDRLLLAVQVTDNSAARIIENMAAAEADGADIAVIAPPYFLVNATPRNVLELYLRAIRNCPLPVGIYDRGKHAPVFVPDDVVARIYAEKKVILVKDSSTDPVRRQIALKARRKNPRLRLLNGWEFNCIEYLEAGYDGLLLGGGIFNGYIARQMIEAVKAGDIPLANRLQQRMNRIMWAVYGGRKISCWLAGEKRLLVEMGIFSTWNHLLGYPLTPSCLKAIRRVVNRDADVLMPWKNTKAPQAR